MISTSTSTSTKRPNAMGRKRQNWEPGTTAVLGVRTYFYPHRDGELLFGDASLKSAGALVRVIGETLLPTRRGASLRRVLVEAGIGGSGPYAWVDADDLEPRGQLECLP